MIPYYYNNNNYYYYYYHYNNSNSSSPLFYICKKSNFSCVNSNQSESDSSVVCIGSLSYKLIENFKQGSIERLAIMVTVNSSPVKFFFLLVTLLSFSSWTQAETLTLYNHTNHYGDFILLNIKGCTNVPKKWRDSASSLDVHGSCLVFYDDFDCLGKRVTLQPHHRKYMENLETLGFNDVIKSARPCGQKIQRGIHVIQSPMDGTVLTIKAEKGEFYANTMMTYWRRKKSQLWSIGKYGPRVGINYDLTPVSYPYYNPVTYTKFESKKNALGETYMPRRFFDIQPLPENKYLIKVLHTDKCLVNNGRGKPVGKTVCAPWMPNQQWQFIRIDRAAGNKFQPAPPSPNSPPNGRRPPFL